MVRRRKTRFARIDEFEIRGKNLLAESERMKEREHLCRYSSSGDDISRLREKSPEPLLFLRDTKTVYQ